MRLILSLGLQVSILLTLCVDLGQGLATLPLWGRATLLLVSAGGTALTLWPSSRYRTARRHRLSMALLGIAAFGLGVIGLIAAITSQGIRSTWQDGAVARLETRATAMEQEFARFLSAMVAPLESVRDEELGRAAGFAAAAEARGQFTYPRERFGISIYDSDGSLIAWDGNTSAVPYDLLARASDTPAVTVDAGETTARLFAAVSAAGGAQRWVAEFLLRSPALLAQHDLEARLEFEFLRHWQRIVPVHIQIEHPGVEDDALLRLFERHEDRLWSRQDRQAPRAVTIPLRASEGDLLATVSLRDRSAEFAVSELRRWLRRIGALFTGVLLMLTWGLWLARAGADLSSGARLLGATIAIWSTRWVFLLVGNAADLPDIPIYDITLYASSAFGGLLRSAADLLLTALSCLAQAVALRRFMLELPLPRQGAARRATFIASLPGLPAIAIGGGAGLYFLINQMVLDSRIDLLRPKLDAQAIPGLALQAALLILAASLVMVILSGVDYAARCRGLGPGGVTGRWFRADSTDRLPLPLRATAGLFVLSLLYVPFLQHAYDKLRLEFFEDDLVPRVVFQAERRMEVLKDALATTETPEFGAAARFALDRRRDDDSELAYRLWRRTSLAEMGLASSLRIYDQRGRMLTHFAVNVAPTLAIPFEVARRQAGGPPELRPPPPGVTVRKSLLYGARWLRSPRRQPLLIVMAVAEGNDNVPMIAAGQGYLSMISAHLPTRTNPELLRFEPMLAVFEAGPRRIFESDDVVPLPTAAIIKTVREHGLAWSSAVVGGHGARIVYFGDPDTTMYALAHPQPDPEGRVATFLRLFLLNALIAASLMAIVGLARAVMRREAPRLTLGTTFYTRLTVIFLLTALVPLLALAFFVTRFSAHEFERGLTAEGLRSLQTARRVMADYIAVSAADDDPLLDHDVVFWLSQVVRRDISLYRDGQLAVSSTPELYTSGILNQRLPGEVYRALYIDGDAYQINPLRLGGVEALILSAPMPIDPQGTIGVVSIPLARESRAVALKVRSVRDASLISTCLTVLLLAAVGWLVARRISQPIAQLARAARRVQEGDLAVRVRSTSRDEIGTLVTSFNRMADALLVQREDLQRRKDYIEKILTSATTGVVSLDGAGAVITINPEAQRLLKRENPAPHPGQILTAFLKADPGQRPLLEALERALAGGEDSEVELNLDQREAEMRLRAVFLRFQPDAGGPAGLIVLLEDVTRIVRSGRLAAWTEMARRIAHEVKNPLTPIQLSVEHLRRVWHAGDARFSDILQECLGNIEHQVRSLRRIASEFATYARLPELRMESSEVEGLIHEALRSYVAAPPPGVSFTSQIAPGLPPVMVDRTVMVRALVNLVENALQAIDGKGSVCIAAGLEKEVGGAMRLRIEVRDTGPGIEPAARERLFEPYFSTKIGGTGLGLAIARKTAEEHGGTIDIDGRAEGGTIVVLRLPMADSAHRGRTS